MAKWIIDAGHGGEDFGAVGSFNTKESEFVLEASYELKRLLERNGEACQLVRTSDVDMTIRERLEKIENLKGDYFVSLHMNSSIDKDISGTEVYIFQKGTKSEELAKNIRDRLTSHLKNNNRGVREASYQILRELDIPAVIVEGEYLSNEEVERKLKPKEYGKIVAEGCLAIVNKVLISESIRLPKKSKKQGWRVCIDSSEDINDIEKRMKELKLKGIENVYMVPYK